MTELQNFDFAEHAVSQPSAGLGMDAISEQLKAAVTGSLNRTTGHRFSIELLDQVAQSLAEILSSESGPADICKLGFSENVPSIYLRFDRQLTNLIVEIIFGGKPAKKDSFQRSPRTKIEEALLGNFAECFAEDMITRWFSTEADQNFRLEWIANPTECSTEVDPQTGFLLHYECEFWDEIKSNLSIFAPQDFVQILLKNSSDNAAIRTDRSDEWEVNWSNAIREVHFPVRTILAQPELKVSEVMNLKAGDVIPLVPRSHPPLFVADRKFATGVLGEKDGCAAFKIERFVEGEIG